ncbi:hypothetical protein WN943_011676 [Citrus x changshan-huyou]
MLLHANFLFNQVLNSISNRHKNHRELKTHKLQPGTRATPTHEQQHQHGLDREQFQWLPAARTTHEQQRQLPEARAVPAASGRQCECVS